MSNNFAASRSSSSSSSSSSGSSELLITQQDNVGALHDFPLRYHVSIILYQSFKLLSILVHGTPRWIAKLVRLILFVFVLLPAFVRFSLYYFLFSDRIAIAYKDGPSRTSRHYLDVYGSQQQEAVQGGKAVVIFLTGGAWIIGYKMWGALLARALVSVIYKTHVEVYELILILIQLLIFFKLEFLLGHYQHSLLLSNRIWSISNPHRFLSEYLL
jgi:hypothetical protein